MTRFVNFAFAGAASLALIACHQTPTAEAEQEAANLEAMANDLRSDAEKAAGMVESQVATKPDAVEAKAEAVSDGK